MVMYDGTETTNRQLADELGLTFPILADPSGEVFSRFNSDGDTPESAFIAEGMSVHTLDVIWYPALIEEVLYGE
jgi:hypothetical protein